MAFESFTVLELCVSLKYRESFKGLCYSFSVGRIEVDFVIDGEVASEAKEMGTDVDKCL